MSKARHWADARARAIEYATAEVQRMINDPRLVAAARDHHMPPPSEAELADVLEMLRLAFLAGYASSTDG